MNAPGSTLADSAFAVAFTLDGTRGDALRSGHATVKMATQAASGTIRYTVDGAAPTTASAAYAGPLTIAPGAVIRAVAFGADGHAIAGVRAFDTGATALLTRGSSDLTECPKGKLGLRVPLDPDQTGVAPAFNVNIFDTCTRYPAAPLDMAGGFTVDVARLARNYGLAHEVTALRASYNVTPHGELVIRAGGCDGDVVATFSLPDPATAPQRMHFSGSLPRADGDRDLCMLFTSPLADPFYTVERMQLIARAH